jgi:hypothetical protein
MKNPGQVETKLKKGPFRRSAIKGSLTTLCALALVYARPASAVLSADSKKKADSRPTGTSEGMDRIAITDVIARERWSRETHNPEVAASCFIPDAWIEVSWFKGTATQFIESGKRPPPPDTLNFDSVSTPVIWIQKDRAISETSCAVHTVLSLDDTEVINISYTRLLWRVQRLKGEWLIAGLRCIYIRDTLQTCGPNQELKLDKIKLAGFRPSYRYLSYVLTANGRPAHDDLPGVDRPESVEALRVSERQWLRQA